MDILCIHTFNATVNGSLRTVKMCSFFRIAAESEDSARSSKLEVVCKLLKLNLSSFFLTKVLFSCTPHFAPQLQIYRQAQMSN